MRTFKREHLLLLIYLLENVMCKSKKSAHFDENYMQWWDSTTLCFTNEDKLITLSQTITIGEHVSFLYDNQKNIQGFLKSDGAVIHKSKEKQNDIVTLVEVLCNTIKNSKNKKQNDSLFNHKDKHIIEAILYNLGCEQYQQFNLCLNNYILPAHLQNWRLDNFESKQNTTNSGLTLSDKVNFLFRSDEELSKKYKTIQKREDLPELSSESVITPLLQGFHLYLEINQTSPRLKFYNKHWEPVNKKFLNSELQTAIHNQLCVRKKFHYLILEIIVLPTNQMGKMKNWRFWNYRTSETAFVLDIIKLNKTDLWKKPYRFRYDLLFANRSVFNSDLHRILANNFFLQESNPDKIYQLIESLYDSVDFYNPFQGVIVNTNNQFYKFYFTKYVCMYDFYEQKCIKVNCQYGHYGISNYNWNLYVNPEYISKAKIRLIVYGEDETYIYCCKFERNCLLQFVHYACIEKKHTDKLNENLFIYSRKENLYVVNALTQVLGYALIRFYFDEKNTVVDYEQKMTDSVYDVPHTISL